MRYLVFIIFLFIIACSPIPKEELEDIQPGELSYSDLAGTWRLVKTCGGITGDCNDVAPEDSYAIQFSDRWLYSTASDKTEPNKREAITIEYDNDEELYQIIKSAGEVLYCTFSEMNDTLWISHRYPDGIGRGFVREF